MVMTLPESDRYSMSRDKCVARMAMLFGGREAEIFKFGSDKVTNGADRRHPDGDPPRPFDGHGMGHVRQARACALQGNEQEVFLGHSVTQTTNIFDETAKLIDQGGAPAHHRWRGDRPQDDSRQCRPVRGDRQGAARIRDLTGDQLRDLVNGKMPSRDDNAPPPPRSSAVPKKGAAASPRPIRTPGWSRSPRPDRPAWNSRSKGPADRWGLLASTAFAASVAMARDLCHEATGRHDAPEHGDARTGDDEHMTRRYFGTDAFGAGPMA